MTGRFTAASSALVAVGLAKARMSAKYSSLLACAQVIKSGLRRIRFHDNRHTHATHMLASNVHPKIASERMGHSRVGVTLDTYSHVLEGMQNEAVSAVDAAMAEALHRPAADKQR